VGGEVKGEGGWREGGGKGEGRGREGGRGGGGKGIKLMMFAANQRGISVEDFFLGGGWIGAAFLALKGYHALQQRTATH